ncbi:MULTISPECIES: phage tail sheath family protein [Flavobacteriales]|uniref:phage tail sheath family protein n=1 Tax=Flavobacteriales TaxID=200644 RepID=UPI003A91E2B6
MPTAMKTPGVYIREQDAFGNSVVPVPTAIPAFIGYTAQTSFNGKSLIGKAVKITSLSEYLAIFGDTAPPFKFSVTAVAEDKAAGGDKGADPAPAAPQPDIILNDNDGYNVAMESANFRLYAAMKFFYQNGGADCYVMTIGSYMADGASLVSDDFTKAIEYLKKEMEPTMLVIPDAVGLDAGVETEDIGQRFAGAYSLQEAMITHCGEMTNRVAILDIPGGYSEPETDPIQSVEAFRDNVSAGIPKHNSYAAAYYPWLHTTVYQPTEVSIDNVDDASKSVIQTIINKEFGLADTATKAGKDDPKGEGGKPNPKSKAEDKLKSIISNLVATGTGDGTATAETDAADTTEADKVAADLTLKNLSKSYKMIMDHIRESLNLIPPSAAIAGIYTAVDNNEGVWVAPANVGVQGVIAPSINIDHHGQEDLNMPLDGKSVCAIRAFTGRGVLVWGARTLDGNSNDWRYVNVRRTLIYLEQSVKEAAKAYVFAPNDGSTWVNVKSMISNFLINFWKQGGLVGPTPADAFSVNVGLGSTMTGDDVLNGIMRVSVKVAVSRPAEFIEITFQQEMQKA